MRHFIAILAALGLSCGSAASLAQGTPPPAGFDPELAKSVGADDYGMRPYVLVILKTGPSPRPAGPERDEIFKGHFANMKRMADEGRLAVAGPLDGVEGRRGIFVLAARDVDEARRLTATDPVIGSGEMVAEYHRFYSSAALMLVNANHKKLAQKSF